MDRGVSSGSTEGWVRGQVTEWVGRRSTEEQEGWVEDKQACGQWVDGRVGDCIWGWMDLWTLMRQRTWGTHQQADA